MKRFLYSLVAISAIFASCAKEELKPDAPEVIGDTYSFKALISDATKTSIDNEGAMAWITGDQISVYDGEFETFTLKGEASGAEATFTGELQNPSAVSLAVCPAGIGAGVADEIIEFNLPSEYTYDGQSTHAFMIASGFGVNDKDATIKFRHVGGLFKITYNNVPEEAKTFCFEASKQIAGDFMIDYTAEEAAISVDESGTSKSVTYTINSTDDHSSMSFYVPVPVGTFGFNISLEDEGGNKIAKSSKKKNEIVIGRGDYVAIPAINMPKKWVENFDNTKITDTKVGNVSNFTTSGNTEGFDYEWSSNGSVYVFHDGIRLGSGSATGSVKNSSILTNVPAGPFTVKVYAAVWNTDGGKISVTYNGTTLEASPANASISDPTTTDYSAEAFAKASDFVFNKAQDINEFTVGSTQKRIIIDKIEIVEGGVLPEPFSVSTESLTPAWDDTEATFDITAGNNVNWTIGAVEGLTFSKSSGSGNATITVSFAQNEGESQIQKEILVSTNYESVEGEKEYTISFTQAGKPAIELDGDGSVEKPYSVADALYLYSRLAGGESTAEYYVKGTVRTVGTSLSSGKLSYHIGTSEENEIQVYNGNDLGNVNFSAAADLVVGDEVVVCGKIYNYINKDSESIAEINTGNYLYSVNGHTTILTAITLGEKKTVYFVGDDFVKPTVTASYRGKDNATVTAEFSGYNMAVVGDYEVTASYTEDGINKTATYDITVNDNTSYDIEVAVNDNTMGSATVTVGGQAATTAKEGEEVTVTITPNTGYALSALTLNGVDKKSQVEDNEFKFSMPAGNATINVTFAEKPKVIPDGNYAILAKRSSGNYWYMTTDLGTATTKRFQATDSGLGSLPSSVNVDNVNKIWTVTNTSDGILISENSGQQISWTSGNSAALVTENGKVLTAIKSSESDAINVSFEPGGSAKTRYLSLNNTSGSDYFAFYESQIKDLFFIPATYVAPTYYNITVSTCENGTVTVEGNKTQAIAGETITLNVTPESGYKLASLTYNGNDIASAKAFTMPATDVTIAATFEENGGQGGGDKYTLCTSTSDLVAGATYIIASGTSGSVYCMSKVSYTNNRKACEATVTDSQIDVTGTDILILELGGSTGAWTLKTTNYAGTDGFLASAATSTDKNYCRVISDETTGTISFSDNAVVINLGPHDSKKLLRFNTNNGSPLFACYASGQYAIYLYKKN